MTFVGVVTSHAHGVSKRGVEILSLLYPVSCTAAVGVFTSQARTRPFRKVPFDHFTRIRPCTAGFVLCRRSFHLQRICLAGTLHPPACPGRRRLCRGRRRRGGCAVGHPRPAVQAAPAPRPGPARHRRPPLPQGPAPGDLPPPSHPPSPAKGNPRSAPVQVRALAALHRRLLARRQSSWRCAPVSIALFAPAALQHCVQRLLDSGG